MLDLLLPIGLTAVAALLFAQAVVRLRRRGRADVAGWDRIVLFALGLGSAGMNLMTEMPLVRLLMLAMSLVMVAAIAYQISRPRCPFAMRLTGSLSILLTLAIVGWSVLRFGL